MRARLKHMAIISENYALLGKFYEALFGMRTSEGRRPEASVVVTDGYVGLNVIPRRDGAQAGFDHFGIEVDDVEEVFARAQEQFPGCEWLKRPSYRPFAGISMHDPAGNVFDLSQPGMANRADAYADTALAGEYPRRIQHFVLRTMRADEVARFYREVFDLREEEKAPDDRRHYLSDGRVTLIVEPWRISDWAGMGIRRPALDHIGFAVENLDQFRADVERLIGRNPALSPKPLGLGPEGEVRLKLFATCRYGEHQLADPDGVLLDVRAG